MGSFEDKTMEPHGDLAAEGERQRRAEAAAASQGFAQA